MKSKIVFSDNYILTKYLRLIRLLILHKHDTLVSLKTNIRVKLVTKKYLTRLYKKLLRFNNFSKFLHSQIILSYCLLKRYYLTSLPWIFGVFFNTRNLAFFLYHFLVLYKAIFLLKMILDWFPVKNWDRASPLKRFLRRMTIDWTRQFEKYFPSIVAWLIVINIVPIFLSLIETFFVANDFKHFPISYNFDEVLEFMTESNLQTLK